jgi:hypothetical protein
VPNGSAGSSVPLLTSGTVSFSNSRDAGQPPRGAGHNASAGSERTVLNRLDVQFTCARAKLLAVP